MKKLELKARKWLRSLFGCISFTAIAFTFQACYGTGPDPYYDVKLSGTVVSEKTNLPVEGIKVTTNSEKYNLESYGMTDEDGKFSFFVSIPTGDDYQYFNSDTIQGEDFPEKISLHFLDIDGIENGSFADTTILIDPDFYNEVIVSMVLREKE